MPEWLQSAVAPGELEWSALAARLLVALACGLSVAAAYALSQRRGAEAGPLITTLVLLAVLVAMTTLVIGENLARAFGLVGALSIVRFRTVVEDTRDTAFVIFAVVVGMAAGAGYVLVCLVGIPLVASIAIVLGNWLGRSSAERLLLVRIGVGHEPESLLAGVFREQLHRWRLAAVTSARQGAALDLTYAVRLRQPQALLPLVQALHAVDGVQSVELKET